MIGAGTKRILLADYDQKIEAYLTTEGDFGSGDVDVLQYAGLASIDILSGRKALEYQEQGINNPVVIEMNWIDTLQIGRASCRERV